jgi:hypothetical protein
LLSLEQVDDGGGGVLVTVVTVTETDGEPN